MINVGEIVTAKISGKVEKIEALSNGEIRYTIRMDKGYHYAVVTEKDIIEEKYPCDYCGREFPNSQIKALCVANGEDDTDKVPVCQECYDHELGRGEH